MVIQRETSIEVFESGVNFAHLTNFVYVRLINKWTINDMIFEHFSGNFETRHCITKGEKNALQKVYLREMEEVRVYFRDVVCYPPEQYGYGLV